MGTRRPAMRTGRPRLLFGSQHHLRTDAPAPLAFVLEDGHLIEEYINREQRQKCYRRRSLKTGSVSGLPTKKSAPRPPTISPEMIHHPDMLRMPRISIARPHSGITIEMPSRISIEIARSARSCGSAMSNYLACDAFGFKRGIDATRS